MNNKTIFDKVKKTPKQVQKSITAGRLAGFTDINPMWRIEKLTELFGPCGIGWKAVPQKIEIVDGATEYRQVGGKDGPWMPFTEKLLFMDILLFYKSEDGTWSDGVQGFGGAKISALEKNGLRSDDDAYKKAETDAISSACKMLGFSADIYLGENYDGKYQTTDKEDDAFNTPCTKQDSMRIVNAAKAKWGAQAAERCSEILKKYGADSTLSLLGIYVENVLEEIKHAD